MPAEAKPCLCQLAYSPTNRGQGQQLTTRQRGGRGSSDTRESLTERDIPMDLKDVGASHADTRSRISDREEQGQRCKTRRGPRDSAIQSYTTSCQPQHSWAPLSYLPRTAPPSWEPSCLPLPSSGCHENLPVSTLLENYLGAPGWCSRLNIQLQLRS